MRDYKSTQGAWSYDVTRYPLVPCYSNEMGTYTGGFVASESARAELTSGNHFEATGYSAYRRSCEPLTMHYVEDGAPSRVHCDGKYHYYTKQYSGTRYPQVQWIQLVSSGEVHLPIVPSNLVGRARNRCLSKIAASDVNLGQTFGEALHTTSALGEQIARVGRALLYASYHNWGKAAKELGYTAGELDSSVAGQFLAFKFGVQPIINDIYNMHDSISKIMNSDDSMLRAKAVVTDSKAPFWVNTEHVVGTMTHGVEVGVSYKVSDPALAGLNAMGLINPFALAWELLPMSFVIDWFLSVGDYLSGLSAGIGLTFKSGYETTFVKTDVTVTSHNQPKGVKSGSRPQGKVKEFGMYRTPMFDFPKQDLVYNFGLNASQGLVLASLVSQISKL